MRVFNRTNLPESIKYNGKEYFFDGEKSGEYSANKVKPSTPFVFVDVISRRLKGKTDLHGNLYAPSRFIFTLKNK